MLCVAVQLTINARNEELPGVKSQAKQQRGEKVTGRSCRSCMGQSERPSLGRLGGVVENAMYMSCFALFLQAGCSLG